MSMHVSNRPSAIPLVVKGNRLSLAIGILIGLTAVASRSEEPASVDLAAQVKTLLGSVKPGDDEQALADFDKSIEGAEKLSGLFTLYRKQNKVLAEIQPSQFDEMFLAPMAIARGMASAGTPLNFGDEWVLSFKRVGNKVQVIRKNIRYEAPKGSPLEKAVRQNYTDSILMAIPIVAVNKSNQAVLIDLGDIFLSDFAQLGFGAIDRNRTTWHQVKAFKNNIELQVEATFQMGGFGMMFLFGDTGVIDSRGTTLVLHYSLTKRPEAGYKPRFADYRVGHFLNATRDFGSEDPTTDFRRRINRWRLEKADPSAELSPPKKQIVWWVENTVPHEYRPAVEAGILEWNKAFEKIGFRNALGVRWQTDSEDFDPEDTNYCTFRWITTPYTFAMSGLRSDPITGEMIDGDVIFDASWIRAWKNEYAFLMGLPMGAGEGANQPPRILQMGEILSPMLAARRGFGLPHGVPRPETVMAGPNGSESLQVVPAGMSSMQLALNRRLAAGRLAMCQCAATKQREYTLAAMALAAATRETKDSTNGKAKDDDDKKDKVAKKKDALELPEEFIGQAIKEVVMHEVGHSLGLRHNFRASTIRSLDEINDVDLVRSKGMVGSVMDYNPLNIVRKGQKQGDYAAVTIGPYDYWAIEYAYRPIDGDEAEALRKIAARSPQKDLTFATDEDMFSSYDPMVNVFDLGDDPLDYVKDRVELDRELLGDLDERVVRDGEMWSRLRSGFSVLLSQFGNAAYVASSYIGGQHVARDAKGGDGRDPVTPVDFEKQREALDFLVRDLFSDKSFQFAPRMLRRLTDETWLHWGSYGFFGNSGFDVYQAIAAIQNIALSHCFDATTLHRLHNQQMLAESDAKPLTIAELFRTLTTAIWSELDKDAKDVSTYSAIRRNLQREHVKRLCRIVLGRERSPWDDMYPYFLVIGMGGGDPPADARSLARLHLREIRDKIEAAAKDRKFDDVTRAHLDECRDAIGRALESRLNRNEP